MNKLGTEYGGWNIPKDIDLDENSIIYSVGVGEDISFDLLLSDKYNSKIVLVDATKRAIKHFDEVKNYYKNNTNFSGSIQKDYISIIKNLNPNFNNFTYIDKALWDSNTTLKFFKQTNDEYVSQSLIPDMFGEKFDLIETITLDQIMKIYNHTKIDLLKLDIEGAEINVLKDMLNHNIYPRYLCIEFDLYLKNKDKNNKTRNIVNRLLDYYTALTNDNLNVTFKLRNDVNK